LGGRYNAKKESQSGRQDKLTSLKFQDLIFTFKPSQETQEDDLWWLALKCLLIIISKINQIDDHRCRMDAWFSKPRSLKRAYWYKESSCRLCCGGRERSDKNNETRCDVMCGAKSAEEGKAPI